MFNVKRRLTGGADPNEVLGWVHVSVLGQVLLTAARLATKRGEGFQQFQHNRNERGLELSLW